MSQADFCNKDVEAWNKLDKLERKGYSFHLTGSRFFGTERPDSDWDFFAEYSEALHLSLEILGFKSIGKAYEDMNTAFVFVFHNLHIQLQINLKAKIAVQEQIKRDKILPKFSKDNHREVWDRYFNNYRVTPSMFPRCSDHIEATDLYAADNVIAHYNTLRRLGMIRKMYPTGISKRFAAKYTTFIESELLNLGFTVDTLTEWTSNTLIIYKFNDYRVELVIDLDLFFKAYEIINRHDLIDVAGEQTRTKIWNSLYMALGYS